MITLNLSHLLSTYQTRIEDRLAQYLPNEDYPLHLAMRYCVLNPGKRVRPLLVYATGECFGVTPGKLDAAAAAIEYIHCYSLVHDDLPCMDDDDLRRGQPTCHKQYNEATAILVGDALQSLAFDVLAKANLSDPQKIHLIRTLSQAIGANGMVLGQALDMQAENQTLSIAQLETLHHHKTAALIQAALLFGGIIAEVEPNLMQSLGEIGRDLGLAFQIQDDLLDTQSDTTTLGKTAGRDATLQKSTYPQLLGETQTRARLNKLQRSLQQRISLLPGETVLLNELINMLANRQY